MKTLWKHHLAESGAEYDADGAGDSVAHYGNPVQEREVALSGTVFSDLTHLGVIGAHGADAQAFLQSQLGNDINALDVAHSQLSSYCTPKGRMLGLFRIFRTEDSFYLRLPADTLDAVLQRLRMFVLRADVTLEDASEAFIRLGVAGRKAADILAGACGQPVPEAVNAVTRAGDLTILRVPGVLPRFEVYAASLDAAKDLWDALNVDAAPVGMPAWRLLEILAGLPAVYAGTSELFVPQMANLQLVDGVSFKKGCYPGQEIVARMQYLGTLKRRMYLGRIATDEAVAPGASLFSAGNGEQVSGRIVDAQPHPDGGQAALAVLQIGAAEAGDLHLGSADGPAFDLETLPYPFEAEDDK
jgi:folate-binding protein YgfZ